MEASYASVLDRVEQVLDRQRADGRSCPSQQEIDDLYTDACATVLLLESEVTAIERRLAAAASTGADDAETIRYSRDLARRRVKIDENLAALRSLVDALNPAAGARRFT